MLKIIKMISLNIHQITFAVVLLVGFTEKHPQLNSMPLKAFINIAIMKIKRIEEINTANCLIYIPIIIKDPINNSIHGNSVENTFSVASGRSW